MKFMVCPNTAARLRLVMSVPGARWSLCASVARKHARTSATSSSQRQNERYEVPTADTICDPAYNFKITYHRFVRLCMRIFFTEEETF